MLSCLPSAIISPFVSLNSTSSITRVSLSIYRDTSSGFSNSSLMLTFSSSNAFTEYVNANTSLVDISPGFKNKFSPGNGCSLVD